ncbi:NIPSNAP family protein [Actinomadura logoneensis]|uniref:NIPSNAP family protein n=1 Tax=Actinomadura logoneensis TaxID=2293572 RepID=UPI0018F1F7EB|nr:NIPSNAP family protein [Actinomadura logoneensis]
MIELRRYTLRPGRRDELIELFDREFVEPQEEAGTVVFGQFRDMDDPDRFVWLRGFRDMAVRRDALTAFSGGPVWAEHAPGPTPPCSTPTTSCCCVPCRTGPAPLAALTTETARNTFPRLPVRTGKDVAVVLTSYPDEDAHRRHLADVLAQPLVRDEILPGIERAQTAAPRTLRLAPTGRSLIA